VKRKSLDQQVGKRPVYSVTKSMLKMILFSNLAYFHTAKVLFNFNGLLWLLLLLKYNYPIDCKKLS